MSEDRTGRGTPIAAPAQEAEPPTRPAVQDDRGRWAKVFDAAEMRVEQSG